jgi:hypothetical protein
MEKDAPHYIKNQLIEHIGGKKLLNSKIWTDKEEHIVDLT